MYKYLLNQWILRKIDETYLTMMVNKGRITQEQYNTIVATPQVTV
jgi:membrane peptidoglycan carboxypeptidase